MARRVQITSKPYISAKAFKDRFTMEEQGEIMTTPALAPLVLEVVTAPNGVDPTDATAQMARAALSAAGWTEARLDEVFWELADAG